MNIFIVGFGDIGRRIAQRERERGNAVTALTRRSRHPEQAEVILRDLDVPLAPPFPRCRNHLLYYLVPPPCQGKTDPRMRHWLACLTPSNLPRKVIYISTTGVYGDCRGAWVDEERPPAPQTDRARRRLDAERQLASWSERHNIPVTILRAGGIYGPNRLPIAAIRQRRPVLRNVESPCSNRIHVHDLVRIMVAAGHQQSRGITLYNVTDGRPSTMTGYFHAVADAFGLPRCPEIGREAARQQLSPGMLSYLAESRRIDNRKMLRELSVTLKYPDMKVALKKLAG